MNLKNRPDAFKAFSSFRIGENTFSDTQALLTMGDFSVAYAQGKTVVRGTRVGGDPGGNRS